MKHVLHLSLTSKNKYVYYYDFYFDFNSGDIYFKGPELSPGIYYFNPGLTLYDQLKFGDIQESDKFRFCKSHGVYKICYVERCNGTDILKTGRDIRQIVGAILAKPKFEDFRKKWELKNVLM